MKLPVADGFWSKVQIGPDCWIWIGFTNRQGYGYLAKGGTERGNYYAHRVSWEIHFGLVPHGMLVLHHCDNPSCVNPAHLWLGTNHDNVRDRDKKSRGALPDNKGESNGQHKLIASNIPVIRSLDLSQRAIGKIYGITQPTVSEIRSRKLWAHVL
jgi:hypothetical protein